MSRIIILLSSLKTRMECISWSRSLILRRSTVIWRNREHTFYEPRITLSMIPSSWYSSNDLGVSNNSVRRHESTNALVAHHCSLIVWLRGHSSQLTNLKWHLWVFNTGVSWIRKKAYYYRSNSRTITEFLYSSTNVFLWLL